VDVLESMGSDKFIHFGVPTEADRAADTVATKDLIARVGADSPVRRGADVDLHHDPAKISVFDGTTGVSLM
ncbi:ABC transporter ATP-binding protein, partial [Tsukamurella tyrosinosolvens]